MSAADASAISIVWWCCVFGDVMSGCAHTARGITVWVQCDESAHASWQGVSWLESSYVSLSDAVSTRLFHHKQWCLAGCLTDGAPQKGPPRFLTEGRMSTLQPHYNAHSGSQAKLAL